MVPWPISDRAMRIVIVSSGAMVAQIPTGTAPAAGAASAAEGRAPGQARVIAPADADTRKARLFKWEVTCIMAYAFPLAALWMAARMRP